MKVQIHDNVEFFLYHEDLRLLQNLTRSVSDPHPDWLPSNLSNGTNAEYRLGTGTIYQSDAPLDLKVVSWAPGVPSAKLRSYAYDPKSGGESTIYIIDNGIDGRNRVTA